MKNTLKAHKTWQYILTMCIYIIYISSNTISISHAESIDDWFVGSSDKSSANLQVTHTQKDDNAATVTQNIMHIYTGKDNIYINNTNTEQTGNTQTATDGSTMKIIGSRDGKTAEIAPDTQVKSTNKTGISIDSLGFYILGDDSIDPFEKRLSMGNDILFKFGIPGKHLIFSKPIKITIPTTLAEGKDINIDVKHEGDQKFNNYGLSTNPNTQCNTNGGATIAGDRTNVKDGKIVFYICGASTFSLTYVGGANLANFADLSTAPGYIDKTVTFITGTHFPIGATITDVNLRLHFRPIDTENPASFGNGSCFPREKYFNLRSPGGTTVNIINANQLTAPSTACPASDLIYDDQAVSGLSNNYGRPAGTSWKPVGLLSSYNGQSPFGTWTLRMGDNLAGDGVILYGFTITIVTEDPGGICISSPTAVISGSVASASTIQSLDYIYDHFTVDDQKGSASGYYTTLSISDLTSTGGSTIPKSSIQRMADPITTLAGTSNPAVTLAPVMTSFHVATSTDNFIMRSAGTTAGIRGKYGSQLRVRVNVPAYTTIGQYTGTITYTLYEN